MRVNRDSGLQFGLGVSFLIHGLLGLLVLVLPRPEVSPVYREIIVELPPLEEDVREIEVPEPEIEPELSPVEPVSPATPVTPVPITPAPRVSTPTVSSRQPSAEEVLADVADLAALAERSPLIQANSFTNRTSNSVPLDLDTSREVETEGQEFLNQNRVSEIPSNATSSSLPNLQNPELPGTRTSINEDIASLQRKLDQQSQTTDQLPRNQNESAGFTDPQIDESSGVAGRGLVAPDRFNLGRYIQQSNPNWPTTITVEFRVNAPGFVTAILNEGPLSFYTDLHLAVLQMFQGQAFVAVRSPEFQEGSITFRLRD